MSAEAYGRAFTLGVGVVAGLSLGALLWRRRASRTRTLLLKALEGETIRIPVSYRQTLAGKVVRAFYGHPGQLWSKAKGFIVTNKVKTLLLNGQSLKADNAIFGDPMPGVTKILAVEVDDDPDNLAPEEQEVREKRSVLRAEDTNAIPQRPVHYVLRPQADPRIDEAMYVRYDPLPGQKSGACIIVIPGGNYDESGINGGEGQGVAHWLVELGITAIVLKYRCVSTGHYWPSQYEDWEDCAKAVKRDAASWGCDADRVGVIGFSAGGHLAGYAAVKATSDIRPKLQILVYPAIDTLTPSDGSMDPWHAHLGYPPKEESIHLHASAETPQAFLAALSADVYCPPDENTDMYAKLLEDLGVPCKYVLNEDEEGAHGCATQVWWTEPCADWLRNIGWALPR